MLVAQLVQTRDAGCWLRSWCRRGMLVTGAWWACDARCWCRCEMLAHVVGVDAKCLRGWDAGLVQRGLVATWSCCWAAAAGALEKAGAALVARRWSWCYTQLLVTRDGKSPGRVRVWGCPRPTRMSHVATRTRTVPEIFLSGPGTCPALFGHRFFPWFSLLGFE